ncbi:hydrolase TatD [Candidatus Uhrbacteria bacterium CG_4_9_14_0_2_um_filter_41_50]|uniref:Hydrolase TatD n=1 Tax=Candidatus Uhrbacteria bacterium CG_4_9_14_0_2_um_filter_41_50 TaxID=1975031 RepID=A0A2M8EP41_9BACT|nr:MAG: hydrolase TatD [Candidatus Uhrbacteria bacterium CG_4_10_14_3_um_filter_41_21]PIZ55076.1 MAG: hydrolase TatD [Candidatus Uhrbacteria bacterium CG_4_10_14_0_2_um_filter_41_21]PJB85006.1 MAG: hydrolase TatD [Candidatus Uhrbacteria bacterium CG_4_9_14_0_8_um_filter_41_16]PJC24513.1 MAG: hydrolase TatD [Candidatus Uhrbacteria bacterium CG_4_9_14_0_2_um_filter_41_50]PJE74739.1 MAG: hydrolase TatD [Candidatus Uhrbacteria bacterium CG10_big_fil_rev_8_21_14_0_10_41_26]
MTHKLIDTHCHVNFQAYKDDAKDVIARSLEDEIAMITVGSQSDTSKTAIELAEKYDGVWAAIGLHPNHLYEQKFIDEQELKANAFVKTRSEKFDFAYYAGLAHHPKVVAIGENGLDYYRLPDGDQAQMKEDQKRTARAHIDLASEVNKPIIVHVRDAHADQYEILKLAIEEGKLVRRGVIHCFTGTYDEAQKYIELGFMISFTGILTFSKELQAVAKELPLSSIMVETDAPYLAPTPHRGKRNEPAYVKHVAEKLAEIKGLSFDEVAKVTTENAIRFFDLK